MRGRTAEQSYIQGPGGKIYDGYRETICTFFKSIIFLNYSQTAEIPLYFRLFFKYQGEEGRKHFGPQGTLQDHQKEGLRTLTMFISRCNTARK